MGLKISRNSAAMLNCMLRQPNLFPLQQAGMQKPFSADGIEMTQQIVTLRKWFEQKVVMFDRNKKDDTLKWPEENEPREAKLPKSYVNVLKKILDYYKPVGMLVDFSEMYCELRACLDGKDLDDELDSLESLEAEPVVQTAVHKDEVREAAAKP